MTEKRIRAGHQIPLIFYTATFVLTIAAFLWFALSLYNSYLTIKNFEERELKISELRGEILLMDEILTMSARMSAATGNPEWEERYHKFEQPLDDAIKNVRKLISDEEGKEIVVKTDIANVKLIGMENTVFALVHESRLKEAAEVLQSKEYVIQKKIYSDGMNQVNDSLSSKMHVAYAAAKQRAHLAYIVVIVFLPIVFIAWLIFLKILRKWQEAVVAEKLRSESLLNTVIDRAMDAVIVTDEKGMITIWNQSAESIFGWSQKEVLGREMVELIFPRPIHGLYRRVLSQSPETKKEVLLNKMTEMNLCKKSGNEFPAELSISPSEIKGHYIFSVAVRDISERKQTEKRIATEHAVMKILAEEEIFIDAAPKIIQAVLENLNFVCGAYWGLDKKSGVLRCFSFLGKDEIDISDFKKNSQKMAFSAGMGFPGRIWKSGKAAWISDIQEDLNFYRASEAKKSKIHGAFGFPIRVGNEILGVIEFFSLDFLDPDKELIRRMENIETEIGLFIQREISRTDLKIARDQALEASRAKSEFLATMSHEIRTPMNAIIGMADLLEETVLNREQSEYVRIFKRAGDTLLSLINDILDLAKVESGNLELEHSEFNIYDLVERTAEFMAIRAHQKGLELACRIVPDVPAFFYGDAHRIRQVLVNLLGNAIKFTETGEVVIKVAVGDIRNETCRLLFSVKDTGIGVPADKRETIFQSFSQVDSSTTRKYGGTGLGLAISKKLLELMGGAPWVESNPGGGSIFSFSIPLKIDKSSKQAVSASSRPSVEFANMRVLIVDDNSTNRLILKEIFSRCGAEVSETEGGESAVSLFLEAKKQGKPYQLILLDCRMPGKDGFEVAEELKEISGIAETIVMMLTSENRYGDILRAKELGLSGYIVKPIIRAELLSAVSEALKGAQEIHKHDIVLASRAKSLSSVRPLSILVAEDALDNRLLIQAYFKGMPFLLAYVENGQEAVEKFTSSQYDLILMDVQMPVMDGFAATREIRKWEMANKRKLTPIVALTANAFKEDQEKCLKSGFSAYLSKPVKKTDLLKVINELTQGNEPKSAAA